MDRHCGRKASNYFRGLLYWLLLGLACFSFPNSSWAIGQRQYVEETPSAGCFTLFDNHAAATICVDPGDFAGVIRAAGDLKSDILRVSGVTPILSHQETNLSSNAIFVGTLGKSEVIDRLVAEKKIDVTGIRGQWESFLVQVVTNPLPGVATGLVIAGSDKRGTIFGIYDLSEQMGVSPWYWWADAAVERKSSLFIKAGTFEQGPPSVKYRGIFLNDEAPDLTRWIEAKFGNIAVSDSQQTANYGRGFYTNLFELILRLKGNYLWPAMWNNRFNEDDPADPRLADEYGIVMGTSHQEPMLRAQKEWDWGANYGKKYRNWNYSVPAQQPVLQEFWREGVRRNKDYESIFTMGLRAENDSGTPIGKDLTGEIVKVQRQILAEEINPDLTKVPQMWCLYKEVQGFYDEGMTVPDDVTLLWADDNWGDVRRLPTASERERSGGAGIYYHFDYHGGPRSYQWINTSPIAKVWDQLSLAKQYGADRIWIVNVGHFKGYEFPMEFFMNLAWDTSRWTNDNLGEYTRMWAAREFGQAFSDEIAEVIAKSTKFNGRRKPELVDANTYSLDHYNEFERVTEEFQEVSNTAARIFNALPPEKKDEFYEIVYFPIQAAAQLNEMYLTAARNEAYAKQGRASANDMAVRTRDLFASQTNLMNDFNTKFAGGKWDHFMDQPYIGYISWRDPAQNNLDAVKLTEISVPDGAFMGVALDGGEADALPSFDVFNRQRHYVDIFNKGKTPFDFVAKANEPWILLSATNGSVERDQRLWVSVDWGKVPLNGAAGNIQISGAGTNFTIKVTAFDPTAVTSELLNGFVEGEGVVSIEPEHFSKNTSAGDNRWIKIADYGRTLSGMRATGPADAPEAAPGKNSPCLEYRMYLFDTNSAEVTAITSPSLNFIPGRGLRFALSFDDGLPQTVELVPAKYTAGNGNRDWETSVKDNARYGRARFKLGKPGYHTLKLWMIDPGLVVQKLIVDLGGLKTSYLGPPESFFNLPAASQVSAKIESR